MSFLTKSLEKRIQDLRRSIEAQKIELAAYEQVLALESGKTLDGLAAAPAALAAVVKKRMASDSDKPSPTKSSPAISVEFNGSRSDFVVSVLGQSGSTGVTPAEISKAFASHKIPISKNLVYNVLSVMFKQKRVRKAAGKYFLISTNVPAAPKKRRISEEGMRRIIAATKKRWAANRKKARA